MAACAGRVCEARRIPAAAEPQSFKIFSWNGCLEQKLTKGTKESQLRRMDCVMTSGFFHAVFVAFVPFCSPKRRRCIVSKCDKAVGCDKQPAGTPNGCKMVYLRSAGHILQDGSRQVANSNAGWATVVVDGGLRSNAFCAPTMLHDSRNSGVPDASPVRLLPLFRNHLRMFNQG